MPYQASTMAMTEDGLHMRRHLRRNGDVLGLDRVRLMERDASRVEICHDKPNIKLARAGNKNCEKIHHTRLPVTLAEIVAEQN